MFSTISYCFNLLNTIKYITFTNIFVNILLVVRAIKDNETGLLVYFLVKKILIYYKLLNDSLLCNNKNFPAILINNYLRIIRTFYNYLTSYNLNSN